MEWFENGRWLFQNSPIKQFGTLWKSKTKWPEPNIGQKWRSWEKYVPQDDHTVLDVGSRENQSGFINVCIYASHTKAHFNGVGFNSNFLPNALHEHVLFTFTSTLSHFSYSFLYTLPTTCTSMHFFSFSYFVLLISFKSSIGSSCKYCWRKMH